MKVCPSPCCGRNTRVITSEKSLRIGKKFILEIEFSLGPKARRQKLNRQHNKEMQRHGRMARTPTAAASFMRGYSVPLALPARTLHTSLPAALRSSAMNRVALPSTSASSGPSCTTTPSLGRVQSRWTMPGRSVPSALSIGTRFAPASSTSRRGTASAAAPLQDLHPQTHPMAPSASTFDTTPVSLNLDTARATQAVPSAQTILLSDRAKKVPRPISSTRFFYEFELERSTDDES